MNSIKKKIKLLHKSHKLTFVRMISNKSAPALESQRSC